MRNMWGLFVLVTVACNTASTGGGEATPDGSVTTPDGSVMAPDLTGVCTTYCQAAQRQCGGSATCVADCQCREPRPSCRAALSTYLDCASRAVLSCPGGEPAVLCRDERQAYESCRTSTPAPDGGACASPDGGGADASADAPIIPRDVTLPMGTGCSGLCARQAAVGCPMFNADQCDTGCQVLGIICSMQGNTWLACANRSRYGCDSMGRPVPTDCDAERAALTRCVSGG